MIILPAKSIPQGCLDCFLSFPDAVQLHRRAYCFPKQHKRMGTFRFA